MSDFIVEALGYARHALKEFQLEGYTAQNAGKRKTRMLTLLNLARTGLFGLALVLWRKLSLFYL